jgi:hypothetical protein
MIENYTESTYSENNVSTCLLILGMPSPLKVESFSVTPTCPQQPFYFWVSVMYLMTWIRCMFWQLWDFPLPQLKGSNKFPVWVPMLLWGCGYNSWFIMYSVNFRCDKQDTNCDFHFGTSQIFLYEYSVFYIYMLCSLLYSLLYESIASGNRTWNISVILHGWLFVLYNLYASLNLVQLILM